MPRIIFAFNGDLESRLALHWLVHERGHEVVALSLDLGQEVYLEPLGEQALELGASSSLVLDRRENCCAPSPCRCCRREPSIRPAASSVRPWPGMSLPRNWCGVAHEEGCHWVAHGAATKGNDQVRMEAAIAALDPRLEVVAPVRKWNLRTLEDKLNYARRRRLPIEEPTGWPGSIDRNLWGVSLYLYDLIDSWEEPPPDIYVLTQSPEQAPKEPAVLTIGFEEGMPCSLDGAKLALLPLVRELNRLGGLHGVGRSDVVEDRLFGIKSRELYETPAPSILLTAHHDLESLVQSRELIQIKESLSRRYAELVYTGLWFHDLRQSLQMFFTQTQRYVNGEVRLQLYKGSCRVLGRRSPHSLYDGQLANQTNLEWFEGRWSELAQGFTTLWTLPSRLAARQQTTEPQSP